MKKILIIILIFIGITKINALSLTNYSKSSILIEPTTNTIIYENNKDTRPEFDS